MKKIIIVFFIILLLAVAATFVFIPGNLTVRSVASLNCMPATAIRCLHNDAKWHTWFPGESINDSVLQFKHQQYVIGIKKYAAIDVAIVKGNESHASIISVLPLSRNSSIIQWQVQFTASKNPLKRFQQYQLAKNIKNNTALLLDSFKTFVKHTRNVYDFNIQYTTLTDTALVSIKNTMQQYPSTALIYSMIDKLKAYIQSQHATAHNYPMLNITQLEDGSYTVMTGVPTNIPLKGTGSIEPKRMIMLKNKTLVTEVVGDTSVIKKAMEATTNYMRDYQLASPVIPFQQLVTDRTKERDSTKWITRIFSPII